MIICYFCINRFGNCVFLRWFDADLVACGLGHWHAVTLLGMYDERVAVHGTGPSSDTAASKNKWLNAGSH